MNLKSAFNPQPPLHCRTPIWRTILNTTLCCIIILPGLSTVHASDDLPASNLLEVGPDGIVNYEINGLPAKLQLRGDGLSYPALNPDAPERFKLRSNIFADALGIEARVGSISIPGHTGKAKFEFAGQKESRRALWFDKPVAAGFDGSLGPNAVPQNQVKIATGNPIDQTRTTRLPLQVQDGRVGTHLNVGASSLFVMFNPLIEHSIATAGAGQALALSNQGKWSGAPETVVIDFGVSRPVRELTLAEPIHLGDLRISRLLVRDHTRLTAVDDMNSQTKDIDPSEVVLPTVVVTAQTNSSKPLLRVTLGRDALEGCTSIAFDKASKQIELNCAPADVVRR